MILLYKHIGENIRAVRKKAHVTQAVLAEVLSISSSHFSGMECGKKKFTLEQIVMISQYLRVPLPVLFTGLTNDVAADAEVEREKSIENTAVEQAAAEFKYLVKGCSQKELNDLLTVCKIFVEHHRRG